MLYPPPSVFACARLCVCMHACVHVCACMHVCVCVRVCVQAYFSSLLGQTCTTGTCLVGLLFLLFHVEHLWSLRCFFLTAFVWKVLPLLVPFCRTFLPLSVFSLTHMHTHMRSTHPNSKPGMAKIMCSLWFFFHIYTAQCMNLHIIRRPMAQCTQTDSAA